MKRAIVRVAILVAGMILSAYVTVGSIDLLAGARTELHWANVRVLQYCLGDYYAEHQMVAHDLPELIAWGNANGYHFDKQKPNGGLEVSYVRINNDECAFLDLSYGAQAIASFEDFKEHKRRDIQAMIGRKIDDHGWSECNK